MKSIPLKFSTSLLPSLDDNSPANIIVSSKSTCFDRPMIVAVILKSYQCKCVNYYMEMSVYITTRLQ